jgi:hypothetical protein
MILKIKQDNFDWVYLDKIKRVRVSFPDNYAITQCQDNKDELPYLGIRGLSKDKNDMGQIVDNSVLSVDEFILNPEDVLQQSMYNEQNIKQYWGVKIIHITDEFNCFKTIACYSWNEDIYLLNNDGKTIERL